MSKSTILSGIKPTGELHIGNYFGAIANWVRLQEDYHCYYTVVDLHAMTMPYDPSHLQENTERMLIDLFACGIDPGKCILFIQSLVPEHTELSWILSCVCSYGELTRQTQFKDKSAQLENQTRDKYISAGLFTYPVLQAADILIYRADKVPVGKDQVQHLELSREIARRFNYQFGDFFPEPNYLLTETPKIQSLADPAKKMAKDHGPKNYIGLFEEEDAIRAKIRAAVTDTGHLPTDIYMSEGVANLFSILEACGKQDDAALLRKNYDEGNRQYGDLKETVATALVELISPMRARRNDLVKDKTAVIQKVREMSAKAREVARGTLREVRALVGLPNMDANADANWWSFSTDPRIRGNKISSGQGLREVNPPEGERLLLDYHSYIGLGRLLSSQVPSSMVPDERAFIITHQLCELVFKLMIFDLTVVAATLQRLLSIAQDDEFHAECKATECKTTDATFWQPALTASARIEYSSKTLLPAVIGYLAEKETFNSRAFKQFRDYLKPSSGFQTAQFRLIQKALGKTNLLGIRLFPSQEYREKYEGKQGEGPISVIDPVILRGDSPLASPQTGSPLTHAARVDEYAHQTLDRLHRVANVGGTEFHPPGIRHISKGDIQTAVDMFRSNRSDPTKDMEAKSTFREDLEKAVKTENERRAGLTGARKGAFYLRSVAPKPNLAQVLDHLASADSALHTDTKKGSFISRHHVLAAQRMADVKRLAEESGEPEPSPGTGGGGVQYLGHVRNNLIPLFPALIAYID